MYERRLTKCCLSLKQTSCGPKTKNPTEPSESSLLCIGKILGEICSFPRSVTHGICIYASLFSLKKGWLMKRIDWSRWLNGFKMIHSASMAQECCQLLWDEFSWHLRPFFFASSHQATANLGWAPCIFKPQCRTTNRINSWPGNISNIAVVSIFQKERDTQQIFTILFLLHFGYPTKTVSFWETSKVVFNVRNLVEPGGQSSENHSEECYLIRL